jgi:hypothetical protein
MAKSEKEKSDIADQGNQQNIPDKDMLTSAPIIQREHASSGPSTGPTVNEWKPPPYNPQDFVQEEDDDEDDETTLTNSALKNASDSERQAAGKEFAKGAFEVLDIFFRAIGNKIVLFNTKKMKKMHRDGEINLDLRLRYSNGGSETVQEGINRFNISAYDVAALDDEYKEAGAEVLGPKFASKGIGLTPLQSFALIRTGKQLKKIVQKVAGMYSIKEEMMEALREQTANPNPSYPPPPSMPRNDQPAGPGAASSDDHAADAGPEAPGEQVFHQEPEEQVQQFEHGIVQSMDDIQDNRGAGVIHEEFMHQPQPGTDQLSGNLKPERRAGSNKGKRRKSSKK